MVVFENVSKVYPDGTVAVDGIDLHIGKGEIVALIGPSGCGKTTTLKMINRIEETTSGTIRVDGQDIAGADLISLRRNIGYVVQEIALMPHMIVAENIGMVPKLLGWKKSRIDARVDELLDMAGMDPKKYRWVLPSQLSGGQKQRIGVLRALAADPEVILMDEPFGALDPISREKIQNEFLALQKKVKKTIILVTHDMGEALRMSDKVVVMRNGKIEKVGTPREVRHESDNEFVKSFFQTQSVEVSPQTSISVLLHEPKVKVPPSMSIAKVMELMALGGRKTAQCVDENGMWKGMVVLAGIARIEDKSSPVEVRLERKRKLHIADGNLLDAAEMFADEETTIPVIDDNERFLGVVSPESMAQLTIKRLRAAAKEA